MSTHTQHHDASHRFIPAEPMLPGPLWSVTLEFTPQPGMDKAAFLAFDAYMRNLASAYLGAPVSGQNAGPNA